MKICHACKKEPALGRTVGRRDTCSLCGADLHCCLNCRFYDPAVAKQCREPGAELVRDKVRVNFCDFFLFAERKAPDAAGSSAEQARKALDDLFKK